MNALMETFFNGLQNGVLIVSPDGVLRFANRAATGQVAIKPGELLRNTTLNNAMHAAQRGLTPLPCSLTVRDCPYFSGAEPLEVQLMWSPTGTNFVLVLTLKHHARAQAETLATLGELINRHTRSSMQRFFSAAEIAVEALRARNPHDSELKNLVDRAISRGKNVADKLSQLVAIAQAAEGEPVAAQDRIVMNELVRTVSQRAEHNAQARRMRIFTDGLDTELPPIYGSPMWLSRALYELIDCAVGVAAGGSDVLVSATAAGGWVAVSVRVVGSTANVPGREQPFMPFYSAKDAEGLYSRSLGLGLPFARWVIEKHGGRVMLADDGHGIAEFSAELPCGAPMVALTSAESHAQARRYAEDLVRLVSEVGNTGGNQELYAEHKD